MPVGMKHSNLLTDYNVEIIIHLFRSVFARTGGSNKMHDSGPSRRATFGHSQNITTTRLLDTALPDL
jgi:hypothetical protein